MRILAIDTTSKIFCLGIYDNGRVYEYCLESGRKLSALLHITIERVLDAAGLDIETIDYFACGLGPGSFMGVRIGLAAVKGLCLALNKPLIGIPTLDTLAFAIKSDAAQIVPAVDAKRNLIYCSYYRNKNKTQARLKPHMLLNEEEFLKGLIPGAIVFGDALNLYKAQILKRVRGAIALDSDYWYPKAHNLLELALERIKNKKFDDPFRVKPVYLYPKECQVRK